MNCLIKSKYLGSWQQSFLDLDSQRNSIVIKRNQKSKLLALNAIKNCEETIDKELGYIIKLTLNDRVYEIRGDESKLKKVKLVLQYWKKLENYQEIEELPLKLPKAMDYSRFVSKEKKL